MMPYMEVETYEALSAQWVEMRDSGAGEHLPSIEELAELFKACGFTIAKLKPVASMWGADRFEVEESV